MSRLQRKIGYFFIGPRPEGLVIDHIDGNHLNNRVDNLRYVTRSENVNNPNTKPKLVKAVKEAFKNPELRQLISERTKEAMWRPDVREKILKSVKDPEINRKRSNSLKVKYLQKSIRNI